MDSFSDIFGGYLPGEYNLYKYGKRTVDMPGKLNQYRRQLQQFEASPQGQLRLPPSERFEQFMALQSNPESLALSRMRLPQLPFGSFQEFL